MQHLIVQSWRPLKEEILESVKKENNDKTKQKKKKKKKKKKKQTDEQKKNINKKNNKKITLKESQKSQFLRTPYHGRR